MPNEADDAPLPIAKPATVTKAPPEGRKFPCPACGAKLVYDPGAAGLKCGYCGFEETITKADGVEVVENDYLQALEGGRGACLHGLIEGRSTQVRCGGCGAMVLLEDKKATDECPFCHTHLDNNPESAQDAISPESLLPFGIELRGARDKFKQWLDGLWFAPTELKTIANLGQLTGVYLPYWTYDSMTFTTYTGQRGDNYYIQESYTERLPDGRTEQRTRTVTRIRWTPVRGEVQHFFDDILVCGTKSLPRDLIDSLEPWDLSKLEPFQPAFLSGFQTERYALGLKDGFKDAKGQMEPTIQSLVRRDIGGDHQQVSHTQTKYNAITFKHTLLPVWVAVYRYHDRVFQILVNARTGRVSGRRPYSTWKIVRLILLILFGVGILIFLLARGK
jgi:DNA-directed RNA polymerase subunit RPC12/RpoP